MKPYPPSGDNCLALLTPTLRQCHHLSSPKLFFMFLAICGTILYFFPPDCSVFQFPTKTLFSFFCCPVCLPNNNFTITFKSQRTPRGKLILGVKKKKKKEKKLHTIKSHLLSTRKSSHFFLTFM
uniref:Uncharacterized protein n=1 Tax=Pipistrellus kuhlii TaxID=59472 RepID=A0A7J7YX70_PIPKU|nr:hypothetical protein mPipKuh1_009857 [Pipistrellus kuhlii]